MSKQQQWWSGLICVVLASACLGFQARTACAGSSKVDIAIQHGRMTATLDQVPLQAVLEAIKQQTGIPYVLPPAEAERTISVRLHDVPLVEALREICSPGSYVVQVDARGTIERVVILGQGTTAPTSAPQPTPLAAGQAMPMTPTQETMPMTFPRQAETMPIVFPPNTETMPIAPAYEAMPMTFPRDAETMPIVPAQHAPE